MEANSLVPKLRFRGFEGPFKIQPLGNFINLFSGYAFKGNDISVESKGIRLLRGINITEGHIRHSKKIDRYFSGNISKMEKLFLKVDDLVIGMDGSKVGKNVALITEKDKDSLLVQRVARIRANHHSDIRFIYQQILSNKFLNYVDIVNTSSGIPHISAKQIKGFKIGFPSLPEQQKIASFLTSVDKKINLLTKKKALLETYKKGVMQKIFSQELRFKDDNGSSYPDWEEKRLLDFCKFFSGGTPTSTNKEYYTGKIPFIGSGNIYDTEVFSFISEEALASSSAKLVKKGDLLYALYGANSGESAISKLEGAINKAILCIRSKESDDFLNYLLVLNKDKIVLKYLQGGQGNLSAQIIKKLKYKIPSTVEQNKIASFLSSIDKKIGLVDFQLERNKEFKKGLLQQMFV